eukprot:11184435-Lingulodinium_polyedra.AAC.1
MPDMWRARRAQAPSSAPPLRHAAGCATPDGGVSVYAGKTTGRPLFGRMAPPQHASIHSLTSG